MSAIPAGAIITLRGAAFTAQWEGVTVQRISACLADTGGRMMGVRLMRRDVAPHKVEAQEDDFCASICCGGGWDLIDDYANTSWNTTIGHEVQDDIVTVRLVRRSRC